MKPGTHPSMDDGSAACPQPTFAAIEVSPGFAEPGLRCSGLQSGHLCLKPLDPKFTPISPLPLVGRRAKKILARTDEVIS